MKREPIIETSLNMPVTPEFIERRIHLIRGQKVMLDSDLAELYQVETRALVQAVKRNHSRFPDDFLIKLSLNEAVSLRSQFVISNAGRGGRRYKTYAFTELGVAMLSSVLKSERAVQMNIFIMRAFVKLRELLATHTDLARKMEELEKEQKKQGDHLLAVSSVLKRLMDEGTRQRDAIGFVA